MTRDGYVALVEDRYFANMAAGRPELSVAMFTSGGVVTVRAPGRPARVARRDPGAGEESLDHFFSAILETYTVSYRDFWHAVDPDAERLCAAYTIQLEPRDPGAGLPTQELRNANFFQFVGGQIDQVLVVGLAAEALSASAEPTGAGDQPTDPGYPVGRGGVEEPPPPVGIVHNGDGSLSESGSVPKAGFKTAITVPPQGQLPCRPSPRHRRPPPRHLATSKSIHLGLPRVARSVVDQSRAPREVYLNGYVCRCPPLQLHRCSDGYSAADPPRRLRRSAPAGRWPKSNLGD